MKKIFALLLVCLGGISANLSAQQYTGITGLVHVPTAEMSEKSNGRIGGHYLYESLTPDSYRFRGDEYSTFSQYIAFTPFSWVELSYTNILTKGLDGDGKEAFTGNHWFTSMKIQPVKEGEFNPAIAIGTQNAREYFRNRKPKSRYCNTYISATKHFGIPSGSLGAHLTYRQYENDDAHDQWGGIVGGVTYTPDSMENLQISAEYNGDAFITAGQWTVWKYLVLQAIIVDGTHFCGGAGLSLPL